MSDYPNFLMDVPKPQQKTRLYNGRRLFVLEGKVKVTSIQGWVDNPRIELEKKKLQSSVGNRPLTQDEVFTLMKNEPDIRLKELANDIIKNGLREPLTLSYTGKLLDGNRRFFAVKYALEMLTVNDPNRQELQAIEAYVLSDIASQEDEQNVLVEENFSPSLKIEWPDYVKALKVIEALEQGLTPKQIAQKFSWPQAKVNETIRINELINEFLIFAMSSPDPNDEWGGGLGLSEHDAETVAARSYQFFNEAQKSFFDALRTDIDFKIHFFKWIHEGKFAGFQEVRAAHQAWKHPEAKAELMSPKPGAAKVAKAILDYEKIKDNKKEDAVSKIENFVKFLAELTATQIELLPENTRVKLEHGLELVIKMNKAASG